jgi:hypothetical protein
VTDSRWLDAPTTSLEQLQPGFTLQSGHLLADRRGCVTEVGGGLGHGTSGHDCTQDPETLQIDHR